MRFKGSTSKKTEIRKGVRQECVLTFLLINLHVVAICQEAFEKDDGGIKINCAKINYFQCILLIVRGSYNDKLVQ